MTTQSELAALDAAATQGEWTVCVYDCGDTPHRDINGPCPSVQSESEDCAIVHWDGFKQEYWSSANGNQKQIVANAELITTLVNLYRANKLVLMPSVESVARAVDPKAWADDLPIPTRAHTIAFHEGRARSVVIATAVLASMGAKTDG